MNFKYLLVYLLTISTLNLFSQDYEPMLKAGSFWDIKTTIPTNSCSFSDIKSLKRIQIDGDTLINNKTYKKLKKVNIDASTSVLYSCLIPPFIVQTSKFTSIENIYLRENTDEKKLYILTSVITNDELKEYTVCDFSLNVGDRLENYYGSENSDIELILDDIQTDENGKKVFYISDGSYYTEGIGRNEGNLNIYHNLVDGTYERLHCYGNNENQNNCAKVLDKIDYEPVLKAGSFWDIKEESWDFNSSSEITCIRRKRIEVNGDTIINNKIYKKLKQAYFAETNGPCTVKTPFTINESNFKPIKDAFLREDISKKMLYILAEVNDDNFKEFTLCDFNLKKGDTLDNYYWNDENIENIITISDISINENNKKVFYTSSGHTYTEGIGRNDNILVPYNVISDGLIESVFCYGNTENQNNCDIILNTKNHQLLSIKLFPNPVKNILTIQNTNDSTIKIFSLNGSLLKSTTSNHNIKIDISTFKSGIYILEVYNSLGKRRSKILKL